VDQAEGGVAHEVSDVAAFEIFLDVGRSRTGRCVTVGTFDGVHIGHKALISRVVEKAQKKGLDATVITFTNHPAEVVNPRNAPKLLTPWRMKRRLIAELGVETVVGIDFDSDLAAVSAERFIKEGLVEDLQMKEMLSGPSFGFGLGRSGDTGLLRDLSPGLGFGYDVVEKVDLGGKRVSSSSVRRLLESGAVDAAAPLLGREFSIEAVVGRGIGRGRSIGFPTVNLDCDPRQMLPADAVYAGAARLDAQSFAAAVSVGPQPTFEAQERLVEAYLLDYEGDLYGWPIEVAFKERLRAIEKFSSPQELTEQIRADVETIRSIVAEGKSSVPGRRAGFSSSRRP
jgi:riboflavin kinase/FMN adenylyltransferase